MLVLSSFLHGSRVSALIHGAVAAAMLLLIVDCGRTALRCAVTRACSSRPC